MLVVLRVWGWTCRVSGFGAVSEEQGFGDFGSKP